RGDPAKHHLMFANLLDNALKFNLPKGRIEVTARLEPDGGLAVEIRDTGVGIAPEQLPLVVRPFAQADSSLARKYDGAGLGLPLAKLIAEQHGGSLDIVSRPGAGCAVTVRTPASR